MDTKQLRALAGAVMVLCQEGHRFQAVSLVRAMVPCYGLHEAKWATEFPDKFREACAGGDVDAFVRALRDAGAPEDVILSTTAPLRRG